MLTDQEFNVFAMIYETARDKGYQPSLREMAEKLGYKSANSVLRLVDSLIEKAYLKRVGKSGHRLAILKHPDERKFSGFQRSISDE